MPRTDISGRVRQTRELPMDSGRRKSTSVGASEPTVSHPDPTPADTHELDPKRSRQVRAGGRRSIEFQQNWRDSARRGQPRWATFGRPTVVGRAPDFLDGCRHLQNTRRSCASAWSDG